MSNRTISALFKTLRPAGLLLLSGLLAGACTPVTPGSTNVDSFEDISGEQAAVEGTGKRTNLTPAELAIYQSDWKYVNSIVPHATVATLNHADDRQHRFVTTRMKLAGKTRETSPELYKVLDKMRSEHQAKGLPPGSVAAIAHDSKSRSVDPGRVPQHFLASLNILSSTKMEAVATASRIDDIYYGYLDAAVWDGEGMLLGDMNYAEVYSNMVYKSVGSNGNLALTALTDLVGDTLLVEDTVQYGYREFYVAAATSRGPEFQTTINMPADIVGNDGCCNICLNRTWTNDCDVDLTSTTTALKIPLKGSIKLTPASQGAYKLDEAKILQYATPNGMAPGGAITVVVKTNGGGCQVNNSDTSFNLGMDLFWSTVILTRNASGNPTGLSWDMTGDKAATFSNQCRLVQDALELDMNIVVPWIATASLFTGIASVSATNNPSSTAPKIIPCLKETNSCLAAGTMIETAGGGSQTIESLHSGDRVFTPYHPGDMALTVTDTAKGFEVVPMVRIEDEHGRSLLMTEMHPIQVTSRGMVMAKYLQIGDVVTTKDGPSRLVHVSREKYDGAVHNLKVGSGAEKQSLGQDQTVVYANGFLVGDGQIQAKYESIEMSAKSHPTLVRIPSRWHKDHVNSVRR